MTIQPSSVLDIRALPSTQETTARQEGGLFPVLTLAPGGSIVAVIRGGAGHLGLEGRIEIVRSGDAGRTWSPPAVVADSDRDDRNPALGTTTDGTLVLSYHRQGSYDEAGRYRPDAFASRDRPVEVMVTRSTDAGLTWAEPVPLQEASLQIFSPFGKIVQLPDGTLLMPIYGAIGGDHKGERDRSSVYSIRGLASFVVRSTDDGRTWGDPSLIAQGMNETGLVVLADGELLAVLRSNEGDLALWSARSHDGGRTWSEPTQVTGRMQHPADLVLLSDGSILLTYGNRTPPYRVEGRVSRDGGRSWDDRLLAFSPPLYGYHLTSRTRTDLGYPSSVVVNGAGGRRGVTMYYYAPDIPQTKHWREEGPTGPFYRATGYRAITVAWDEAELLRALDGR